MVTSVCGQLLFFQRCFFFLLILFFFHYCVVSLGSWRHRCLLVYSFCWYCRFRYRHLMVTLFCVIAFEIFCWHYYRHCCFTFAGTVVLMSLLLFVGTSFRNLTFVDIIFRRV